MKKNPIFLIGSIRWAENNRPQNAQEAPQGAFFVSVTRLLAACKKIEPRRFVWSWRWFSMSCLALFSVAPPCTAGSAIQYARASVRMRVHV